MSSLESFTLGMRIIMPSATLLEAIRNEPLLIYYASGEYHYVAWNQVLPIGQRKVELEQWLCAAPWTALSEAMNRVCAAVGDQKISFGNFRIYAKYPYTSHHLDKIRTFIPKPIEQHAPASGTSGTPGTSS
jgi:hypothetical protein